jgi:hypothetical protein
MCNMYNMYMNPTIKKKLFVCIVFILILYLIYSLCLVLLLSNKPNQGKPEGFTPIIPAINGYYRPLVRSMRKSRDGMTNQVKNNFNRLSRQIVGVEFL